MSEVTAGQNSSSLTLQEREEGRKEGKKENTLQTQHGCISTAVAERCCVLPVPFYNNTAVVITVAESKRGTDGRSGRKKRHIKDKHSARFKRQDVTANHNNESREEALKKRDETFKLEQGSLMKSQQKTRHQTRKKGNKMAEG